MDTATLVPADTMTPAVSAERIRPLADSLSESEDEKPPDGGNPRPIDEPAFISEDATNKVVKNSPFSNTYAAKKTVAQGMMDIALITANANQLKYIIEYGSESRLYVLALSLILISILIQIVVGICLIFKGRHDLKDESKQERANFLNNVVVVGVFLVTLINVFVASFSISPMVAPPAPPPPAPPN